MNDKILVLIENFSKRFLGWCICNVNKRISLTGESKLPQYFNIKEIGDKRTIIFLTKDNEEILYL